MYVLQKKDSPILRKKLDRVTKFNFHEFQIIFNIMVKIMTENNGIGLAANQIGLNKQIFIALVPDRNNNMVPKMFINPVLFNKSEQKFNAFEEGCLSVDGDTRISDFRSNSVMLRYQDMRGLTKTERFEGFPAVIIQHEYDHLQGRLFIDYTSP